MKKDDEIRLRHMLEAAREALSFVAGKTRSDLDRNRQLVLALVKCIEIIGEAAANVSEDGKTRATDMPWPRIIGMRNFLVHVYFRINLDIVWSTLLEDLPPLIAQLEDILGPDAHV